MSWKFEIYRVLFVVLGIAEVFTNSYYLVKKNGLYYARKQHGELPPNVTDKQLRVKVILMLGFGTAFLIMGTYSYYIKSFADIQAFVVLLVFAIYGLMEAIYYKYWKTIGFSIVAVFLFILYVL